MKDQENVVEQKKEVVLEWVIEEGPRLFNQKVDVFKEDLSIYDSKTSYIFSQNISSDPSIDFIKNEQQSKVDDDVNMLTKQLIGYKQPPYTDSYD